MVDNDMWGDLAVIEEWLVGLGCKFDCSYPEVKGQNYNYTIVHPDFYCGAASTSYLNAKQEVLYAAHEYFTERDFE